MKTSVTRGDLRRHALRAEEALELLNTNLAVGLDCADATRRLIEFGPNRITPKTSASAFLRFLKQFNDPLVYILLVASVVTSALREFVDSAVIFSVVFVNAVIGYVQETQAENAIAALTALLPTDATVRREGRIVRIHSD